MLTWDKLVILILILYYLDCYRVKFDLLYQLQNSLYGTIPSNIATMGRIQTFYIDNNMLMGRIPTSLCQCVKLEDFQAMVNQLSGPIPNCLTSVTALRQFQVQQNQLSGTLPPKIFTNLQIFDVSNNKIRGKQRFKMLHVY